MKPDSCVFKENPFGCSNRSKNPVFSRRNVISGFVIILVTWILVSLHQNYKIRTFHVQLRVDEDHKPEGPHSGKLEEMHDKWIVVTTISQPTKDVQLLARISGWKVLVLGDRKTPSNWSFPGCVFLDIDKQLTLGYSLTSHLPDNSYTRKNIGYLYAIQHGALYIYDTDDDNHPSSGSLNFRSGHEPMIGLLYDDRKQGVIMNPYAHFGQRSIWPRGYPLDAIEVPNSNAYTLTNFRLPAIQQGLVNGDPDLDAIFRLTRKKVSQRSINITFDAVAPPVTLAEGIFAPFNSQNTFFSYEAFWALLLPSSVTFRVTDIWRGYWAQRLLWCIGHKTAFFPPNAVQKRNAHDYLDDFRLEKQFYEQTGQLVSFLANWTCPPGVTFFGCVTDLSRRMAEVGFWGVADVQLVDVWLKDLRRVGYREPEMTIGQPEVTSKTPSNETRVEDFHRVYFSANSHPDPAEVDPGSSLDLQLFCGNVIDLSSINGAQSISGLPPRHLFSDRLLVVVFNHPFFANVRFLDALYRPHFPNIVYCGQTGSYEQLERYLRQGPLPGVQRPLSFINVTSAGGYFGYECAIRAMQMNYDVRGYVIVGDDVLFNFWNFHQLDPDVSRLTVSSYRTIDRHQDPKKLGWHWWGTSWGQGPLEKVFQELETMSRSGQGKLVEEYVANRMVSGMYMSNVSMCLGDTYYIPRKVAPMFVEVMSIFLKHKVFLEIAIPTTIAGLHPTQSHLQERLIGKSIWGGERSKPFEHFNASADYLHPLKLSTVFKDENARKDYCSNYIYHLLKNW